MTADSDVSEHTLGWYPDSLGVGWAVEDMFSI